MKSAGTGEGGTLLNYSYDHQVIMDFQISDEKLGDQ